MAERRRTLAVLQRQIRQAKEAVRNQSVSDKALLSGRFRVPSPTPDAEEER